MKMDDDFTIYSMGLCYASICSSLPIEEVKTRMALEPTGISNKWTLAGESFKTGEPNPCPCDKKPETHKHYLFSC